MISFNEFLEKRIRLIVRTDDIGMNHSSNMALERLLKEGVVTAASVLVNTPWLDEAVDILKDHPETSIGVHTCLNAEWKHYRWGPILSANEVPSLVDQWGDFFGRRKDLVANRPRIDEVEKEVRAQIERALAKGLNVSYVDSHMEATVENQEMRELLEKIAQDYGLAMSNYFGEKGTSPIYSVPPSRKTAALIDGLDSLSEPGLYMVIAHPAVKTPEMEALEDMNANGLSNMPDHRQAELDALCDPRLRELLDRKEIELTGYDVLRKNYLKEMKRPGGQAAQEKKR